MRKIITKIFAGICIVLCIIPEILNAQEKRPRNMPLYDDDNHHWGLFFGYNQMWFSPQYINDYQNQKYNKGEGNICFEELNDDTTKEYWINNISQSLPYGISVGVPNNFRIAKYFDIRIIPTISYGECSFTYTGDTPTKSFKQTFDIQSVTGELPIFLKYKSKRYNNFVSYIIVGVNNKINFTARKNDIKFKMYDFAPEIGTGFDFYVGYFKFGIEIKMSYGIRNMIDVENKNVLTNSFDKLKSKTFQLSFTFE